MSFLDHFAVSDGPKRICPPEFGGLFSVFPPELLTDHEQAGYQFIPESCITVMSYDPDYCLPGDLKMTPGTYNSAKAATLGMIQTAINCTMGVSIDQLREDVRRTLADNVERAVSADFVGYLATHAVAQGGPLQAKCALAEAAQYLNNTGQCGRGLIVGPISWFEQLETTLVWQAAKGYHTDFVGNIVIPHSVDNDTVYALEAAVAIKLSDPQVLDELMPGLRTVNDRVIRAEQLFTVAVDSCAIGSFTVSACCGCASGGGGGGGGGNVTVTNFPANQTVTVSNPCSCVQDVNIASQAAPLDVNVVTPPPTPLVLQSEARLLAPGDSWTPGDVTGTLTSVTFSVLTGTATLTDSNGTVSAGLPAGLSLIWTAQDENTLTGPQSILADASSTVIVNWTQK